MIEMNKHLLVSGIVVLLICMGLSGCNEINNLFGNLDPVVQRANPYISKIVTNDIQLRTYANSIIKDCPSNNKECQINTIYRYIVENFNYVSDPRDTELIQSPQETIQIDGGDCEDLSILLVSLLENIGIRTYLVLTDNHAYSLAFDVDVNNLWNYVEQSLIKQVEEDFGESINKTFKQSFVLEGGNIWYYGGEGEPVEDFNTEYLDISYEIKSDKALDFYVVPSKEDYNDFVDHKEYTHYPGCQESNILSLKDACPHLRQHGGIILSNKNGQDATVDVEIEFYFHPSFYEWFENKSITSYQINGKKSIVLDCTAGKWGYPGYDAGITGEKIAIDPITKEYTYLE